MDISLLIEYFEKYVKNYQPYKDLPEYQAIVKTLLDNYFNISYSEINKPFKVAFEEQIIPVEFYDNLLLSIGYPQSIVNIFTKKDKEILIKSFMDYNRYKGTIEQLRLVGEEFKESIGIYELYIDKKEILIPHYTIKIKNNIIYASNETIFNALLINDILIINDVEYKIITKHLDNLTLVLDKQIDNNIELIHFNVIRWVFVPSVVYLAPNVEQINTYLDYDKIYQQAPRYFVDINQIQSLYETDDIILPIKSNLLFLDYRKFDEVNTLYNLFSAIFLKTYYNDRLVVYFKDGEYSITLGRLYKLWYYLIMKYYNTDYNTNVVGNVNAMSFYVDSPDLDYNINDINIILQEYNTIKTTSDFHKFYYKYISNVFQSNPVLDGPSEKLEVFDLVMRSEVGDDLIEYIDNRTKDYKYEFNFILDEIFNSIITWSILSNDKDIQDNLKYFTNNLSSINYSIDLSPTFHLINFFKPYHVDLIDQATRFIKINDIGNSAILNFSKLFSVETILATTLNIYNLISQSIQYNTYNSLHVLSTIKKFGLNANKQETNLIIDTNNRESILFNEESVVNLLTNLFENNVNLINKTNISTIVNTINTYNYFMKQMIYLSTDIHEHIVNYVKDTPVSLVDDYLITLTECFKTVVSVVDNNFKSILLNNLFKVIVSDDSIANTIIKKDNNITINDKELLNMVSLYKENINLVNSVNFSIDQLSSQNFVNIIDTSGIVVNNVNQINVLLNHMFDLPDSYRSSFVLNIILMHYYRLSGVKSLDSLYLIDKNTTNDIRMFDDDQSATLDIDFDFKKNLIINQISEIFSKYKSFIKMFDDDSACTLDDDLLGVCTKHVNHNVNIQDEFLLN